MAGMMEVVIVALSFHVRTSLPLGKASWNALITLGLCRIAVLPVDELRLVLLQLLQ